MKTVSKILGIPISSLGVVHLIYGKAHFCGMTLPSDEWGECCDNLWMRLVWI